MTVARQRLIDAPVAPLLAELAWPIALSSVLLDLFRLVALYWMGHLGDASGMAALALAAPIELMMTWVFVALSQGAGSLLARSIGKADGDATGILIASGRLVLAVAVPLAVIGALAAGPVSARLGVRPEVMSALRSYLIWLFLGLPARGLMLLLLGAAIAAGHTRLTMLRMVIQSAFIAGLTPVAMTALGFGVAGPAVSQGAGFIATSIALGVTLYRRRIDIGLGPRRPVPGTWRRVISIGSPLQLGRVSQFVVMWLLVRSVAVDSTEQAAGLGVAISVLMVAANVSLGVTRATATVIGHSLGAARPERVIAALRAGAWIAIVAASGMTLALRWSEPAIGLFTSDKHVIAGAASAMGIICWSMIPIATFQLFGDVYTATGVTKLAGVAFVVGDIPALLLGYCLPGPALTAACTGYLVASIVRAAALAALLRHGVVRPVERARAQAA